MRKEIFDLLMKQNKSTIADILAGCIILLYHRPFEEENDSYQHGWNDSRDAIIIVMGLERFIP